jgi:predicted TIM-barrel fold metal-dependent hydrolase
MEDHSDRFMVGTDAHNVQEFVDAIDTVRTGLLPDLTPTTARKIAYQNAQRLFGLKSKPGS